MEIRNTKVTYELKDTEIGLPCTPCQWVKQPSTKIITVIRMSCGGGMGGASWFECVNKIDFDKCEGDFIKVKTIFGEEKTLNKKYMVALVDRQVTICEFDSQNEYVGYGRITRYVISDIGVKVHPYNGIDHKNYTK